ncbi:hypothetical protein LEN26_014675 [Aphanomyces euteiches]|nr:hypothetical protein LEN26_014675 [Aphanomyces euteiches]KAH9111765.1 hypothetical protein AeMF1_013797 [Aphanomyces euteiches]KAH9165202.1 hypothetical protein AeNC1_018558 [Aphanomyces euteiches]
MNTFQADTFYNSVYGYSDDDASDSASAVYYPQATSLADKCGYRTGKCFNMRAMKRNGKDHKLCDYHREKANLNQKKLDRKKRMKRFAPYETSSHSLLDDKFLELDDPLASPTRIDATPEGFQFNQVDLFVMTPAEKLALDEAHQSFLAALEEDPCGFLLDAPATLLDDTIIISM